MKHATLRAALTALLLVLGLAAAGSASALPRFTLMTGARCSNCHVDAAGGGLRTEMGWYAMNHAGSFTWDQIGWQGLHDLKSNTYFNGLMTVGFDSRYQMFKTPPSYNAFGNYDAGSRLFVPMQFAPSVSLQPVQQLTLLGTVNLAAVDFGAGKHIYPGQSVWEAWAKYQPGIELPYLRAGMIQPKVGIRHDDHTMLINTNAFMGGRPKPMIAPYWTDPGAEIGYEGLHFVSAEASVFMARNLADSVLPLAGSKTPPIKRDAMGYSGTLTFSPQSLEYGLNSWLGASVLGSGDFQMLYGFAGIGKTYLGSLMGEISRSAPAASTTTLNYMVIASYPAFDWLAIEARGEWAKTTGPTAATSFGTDAYVFGIQYFPVPFLELRPEYRYIKTVEYALGEYTLQAHVFF